MPSFRPLSRVPSSVLMALVLTLGVGSVSAAAAAPLTAHTVKRIAQRVVRHQARHLTVANADRLGGRPPEAFIDRAVMSAASNEISLKAAGPAPDQTLLGPVPISVPSGAGGILLQASVLVRAPAGQNMFVEIYGAVDAGCVPEAVPGIRNSQVARTVGGDLGSVSLALLVPVAPGAHSVQLCSISTNPFGHAANRALVVSSVGEATIVTDPSS